MILEHGFSYGKLTYIGDKIDINERSARKLPFKCECGRQFMTALRNATLGFSKSCGKCSARLVKTGDAFGDLQWVGADAFVQPESQKKFPFRCKCGRVKDMRLFTVFRGRAKTCGQCNLIKLVAGHVVHGFTYDGPEIDVCFGSGKKLQFVCCCGRVVKRRLNSITENSKCGHCNDVQLNFGDVCKTFTYAGSEPVVVSPWSKKKLLFQCRCGNVKRISVCSVINGETVSCTECYARVLTWYRNNQEIVKKLKCPVYPEDWPDKRLRPLEPILSTTTPFRIPCRACGNIYKPRLTDLKRLKCITCGCVNNTMSAPNCEISEFVRGLGFDVVQEHEIGGKIFDIFVPAKNLLIELQGIRWHSKSDSRKRDAAKYAVAAVSEHEAMWIYEDEWKRKRPVFESLIAHKLGSSNATSLRPKVCDVRRTSSREVNEFYDKFHYIGRGAHKVSYGAYYGGQLIAAMSFRRPSRQSAHGLEMARMASDPRFHVHGIWSKMVSVFRRDFSDVSVVSYSDNRLFTGSVYGMLGFRLDGDVKPDYYWTRGDARFHKSALRKPPGCLTTEAQLRESEGYSKIWDFGKKRWVLPAVP